MRTVCRRRSFVHMGSTSGPHRCLQMRSSVWRRQARVQSFGRRCPPIPCGSVLWLCGLVAVYRSPTRIVKVIRRTGSTVKRKVVAVVTGQTTEWSTSTVQWAWRLGLEPGLPSTPRQQLPLDDTQRHCGGSCDDQSEVSCTIKKPERRRRIDSSSPHTGNQSRKYCVMSICAKGC